MLNKDLNSIHISTADEFSLIQDWYLCCWWAGIVAITSFSLMDCEDSSFNIETTLIILPREGWYNNCFALNTPAGGRRTSFLITLLWRISN